MKFKIKDTFIECVDSSLPVGDNAYLIEFEFDDTWNGLTKTARFVQNGVEYDMVLANDKCAIDDLKQGTLVVGVYATDKATIKAQLKVKASILNGQLVADPTPSVYAQLIAIIGNLDGKVTSAETAAANATASASTATTKATEAAASAANAQTAKTQTEAIKAEVNATATAFNTNATNKTNEFNSNYNTKKSAVDAVATEVATAKSDVQTLKSQTETAKNDAVTAKTGAETAKASIESSATQIATNTADISSVKNDLRTLERKNKALTDLLNGQELRFDTESITGASIDVASGCVADSILKVCGKSIVQDGTIVSSQTDSVKVRNKNIWNPSEATWILNTTTQTLRGYSFSPVSVKAGNTYTVHFESSVTEGYICISKELYGSNAGWVFLNGSTTTATITADSDKIYVCRYGNMPSGNLQIELGSTKTDYEPYEVQTITTSFPVLKSAGSVSDYIDLASARPSSNAGKSIVDVHRLVGSVDLGSLSWLYQSANNRFLAYVTIDAKFVKTSTSVNAITPKFTVTSSDTAWTYRETETNVLCFDASNNVRVYGSGYTDAQSFKTAMNGVMLYYEKATPTTETLEIPTDLLNAINVEAGGQITFVDHNSSLAMPITTTNEWVVRNEEV